MDVRLEPDPAHPDGVGHAVLPVDDELLRDDVEDPPVGGHRDVLRVFEQAVHVVLRDLARAAGDHAAALEALDVVARDADVDAVRLDAGGALGLADRLLHGRHGLVDVDDDAAVEPFGERDADAEHIDAVEFVGGGDDGAHLRRPDIYADYDAFIHGLAGLRLVGQSDDR